MTLFLKDNKAIDISTSDRYFFNWFLTTDYNIEITESREILLYFKGKKLLIRPKTLDFSIFNEIFLQDSYRLSHPGSNRYENIIDIGANVGYFTCALLEESNNIISIEPVAENYKQAIKNISLNGGNQENILNYAVMGKETNEKIKIYVDGTDKGRSSVNDKWVNELNNVELVNVITLNEIFKKYNLSLVDLVKCDVEGAEYDIFLNTPYKILKMIKRVLVEIHIDNKFPIAYAKSLIRYFTEAGFIVNCDIQESRLNKDEKFATIFEAVQEKYFN